MRSGRSRRRLVAAVAIPLIVLGVLALPPAAPDVELPGVDTSFRWDASELFSELEDAFEAASGAGADEAAADLETLSERSRVLVGGIDGGEGPDHGALRALGELHFRLAVMGAAHPDLLPAIHDRFVATRVALMRAAADWPMDRATHEGLYRVVFGGRIALEEALIQAGHEALPALSHIEDIPSAAPSTIVEGVRIHSGDVLLSRGGAPTSALIARGNDFPNTFSHAALAHVDAETGVGTVIESLIEAGSVLNTVEAYLESQKHRILVLRVRPDHPAVAADPLLPHRAAERLLRRLEAEHVPYDFAMEWEDPAAAFCSEIVFHTYRDLGVELWALRASMTARGLVAWLAQMGVREFTSLVPSDLEYDPAVRAVAEWRDADAMMDYRLDNAVIDALLEEADAGARLGYAWYALPAARLLKAYSTGRAALGMDPPIPTGMSAATALQVQALVSGVHPAVKRELTDRAARFRSDNGYEAPYWTLVEMARAAVYERRPDLSPALDRAGRDFR